MKREHFNQLNRRKGFINLQIITLCRCRLFNVSFKTKKLKNNRLFDILGIVSSLPNSLVINTGKSSTRDTGRRKIKEDGRERSNIDLLGYSGWGGGVRFNDIKKAWSFVLFLAHGMSSFNK
jgi:hypothetical protein